MIGYPRKCLLETNGEETSRKIVVMMTWICWREYVILLTNSWREKNRVCQFNIPRSPSGLAQSLPDNFSGYIRWFMSLLQTVPLLQKYLLFEKLQVKYSGNNWHLDSGGPDLRKVLVSKNGINFKSSNSKLILN